MITDEQKETLTAHGNTINSLEHIITESSSALCIEWWEVGRELSDPSYHTGKRMGTISYEDTIDICACLGLVQKSQNVMISSARRFFRKFPTEEDRNTIIAKYRTWTEIRTNALRDRPPGNSTGSSPKARSQRHRGKRPSETNKGRLVAPHNARVIWDNAITEFMESTGEDYATSREILFKALAELDYVQIMRQIWQHNYARR